MGNTDEVKELLESGAYVNEQSDVSLSNPKHNTMIKENFWIPSQAILIHVEHDHCFIILFPKP